MFYFWWCGNILESALNQLMMPISLNARLTWCSSTVKQNGICIIFLLAVNTLNDFRFRFLPMIFSNYVILSWYLNVELMGPYINVYIPLHIVSPWHRNVYPMYFIRQVTGTLSVGKLGISVDRLMIRSLTILYEIYYWCRFFYALLSIYFLIFLSLATLTIMPSIRNIPIYPYPFS